MTERGWLPKEDFDKLDDLFGKLGYGGYYDFLECLKMIASNIGAVYFYKSDDLQACDLQDIKTIPDMMAMIMAWSNRISVWMMKRENEGFVDEVLGKVKKNGGDIMGTGKEFTREDEERIKKRDDELLERMCRK